MKVRIHQDKWYKEKTRFVALYKSLGYRWDKVSDKWVSPGGSSYLLKLDMDGEFKRFDSKDCGALVNFILSVGGTDDIILPKEPVKFIGADIDAHYRWFHNHESGKIPDNFGVVWR